VYWRNSNTLFSSAFASPTNRGSPLAANVTAAAPTRKLRRVNGKTKPLESGNRIVCFMPHYPKPINLTSLVIFLRDNFADAS
jgi:hypothetical protein